MVHHGGKSLKIRNQSLGWGVSCVVYTVESRKEMHCPDCGSNVLAEQQFCRECGAGLGANERQSTVPLPVIALLVTFGGIIVALAGKMLLNENAVVFVGVVISLLGMMSIAIIPLMAAKQARERNRRFESQPARLTRAEPTIKLPPMNAGDQMIPSVIDDTTELLKEPAADYRDSSRR